MRKLDMVFFGNKGISATSARYVCDLAKDLIRVDEVNLKEMSFCHRESSLPKLGKSRLDLGYDESDLMQVESRLERIVRFKRLMAWLREAIKERDNYYDYIAEEISEENLLAAIGEKEIAKPRREGELTQGEYLEKLSRSERTRIYNLQTRAAVLGKAVNENGYLSAARNELIHVMRHPCVINRQGYSDPEAISREPSVSLEQVDTIFFQIVKLQREAQKELNSVMHKVNDAIRYENVHREEAFATAMADYRAALKQQKAKIEAWRKKELHRISNLKIVIPDSLTDVYDEVQALSVGDE